MSTPSSDIHADPNNEQYWNHFSNAVSASDNDRYQQLKQLSAFIAIFLTGCTCTFPRRKDRQFLYSLSSIIYCFLGKWELAEGFQKISHDIDPNDFLLKVASAYIAFHDWEVFSNSQSAIEKFQVAFESSLAAIDACPEYDDVNKTMTTNDSRVFGYLMLNLPRIVIEICTKPRRIHNILLDSPFCDYSSYCKVETDINNKNIGEIKSLTKELLTEIVNCDPNNTPPQAGFFLAFIYLSRYNPLIALLLN